MDPTNFKTWFIFVAVVQGLQTNNNHEQKANFWYLSSQK